MKKQCFVGFDTSNYTTSAAVCSLSGEIVANIRIPLPVKQGERGLRQSDAVFAHIKNLPELSVRLQECVSEYDVLGVGVSYRPRSIEGSYMPCFLSGVAAAKSFAAAANVPVYEFSHQDGHVMAALYSCNEKSRLLGKNFIAFHVSGGTTEMLLASPDENECFRLQIIGETEDISAGQLIDRVGVMMGLKFPCGAGLEALAAGYNGKLCEPRISVKSSQDKLLCNLSGVENIAKKMFSDKEDKNKIAAFVFKYIEKTLLALCSEAMKKYGDMPVIFAGGVMSNKLMRQALSSGFDAYFANAEFSADNASGIALLCREKMKKI